MPTKNVGEVGCGILAPTCRCVEVGTGGGSIGTELTICLIFPFFMVLFWFLWFMIGLKWRIKAWGHIPIFFDDVGTLKKSPNLDPRTPYVLPQNLKNQE